MTDTEWIMKRKAANQDEQADLYRNALRALLRVTARKKGRDAADALLDVVCAELLRSGGPVVAEAVTAFRENPFTRSAGTFARSPTRRRVHPSIPAIGRPHPADQDDDQARAQARLISFEPGRRVTSLRRSGRVNGSAVLRCAPALRVTLPA